MNVLRQLAIVGFGASIAVTLEAQSKGWWWKPTPQGKSVACQIVETESAMVDALNSVGWDTKTTPVVNWETDCAVVIAPSHSYRNLQMYFATLDWRDGAYHVDWSWGRPQESSNQGNSRTMGSSVDGAQTIVVAFPHSVHASNKFFCTEFKPD
jgi:hypothetical protein